MSEFSTIFWQWPPQTTDFNAMDDEILKKKILKTKTTIHFRFFFFCLSIPAPNKNKTQKGDLHAASMFHHQAAERGTRSLTQHHNLKLYNPFSLQWELQQLLQPTTKERRKNKYQQRKTTSVRVQAAQFIYNAICGSAGGVIQRKLCPWWRRTDVIKAVSCCRVRKPTPTTWNYLNHAAASRNRARNIHCKKTAKQNPHVRIHIPAEREGRVPTQLQPNQLGRTRTPGLLVYARKHHQGHFMLV